MKTYTYSEKYEQRSEKTVLSIFSWKILSDYLFLHNSEYANINLQYSSCCTFPYYMDIYVKSFIAGCVIMFKVRHYYNVSNTTLNHTLIFLSSVLQIFIISQICILFKCKSHLRSSTLLKWPWCKLQFPVGKQMR